MSLFLRGGPVMVVLLGLSVAALAIVLLKGWQLLRLQLGRIDFVDEFLGLVEAGRSEAGLALVSQRGHPVAAVLAESLAIVRDPEIPAEAAHSEVARVGSAALRQLEGGLRPLAVIAHLSPLLGLLGTVLGMIDAFMRIEEAGSSVDPAILSGGIWQALLTTAFGLAISIPAMAAFYLFEGAIDRVAATMKDATSRLLLFHGKPVLRGGSLEVADLDVAGHGL